MPTPKVNTEGRVTMQNEAYKGSSQGTTHQASKKDKHGNYNEAHRIGEIRSDDQQTLTQGTKLNTGGAGNDSGFDQESGTAIRVLDSAT